MDFRELKTSGIIEIQEVTATKDELLQTLEGLKVIQTKLKSLVDDKEGISSDLTEGIILHVLDRLLTTESITELNIEKIKIEVMADYSIHMEDIAKQIRDQEEDNQNKILEESGN